MANIAIPDAAKVKENAYKRFDLADLAPLSRSASTPAFSSRSFEYKIYFDNTSGGHKMGVKHLPIQNSEVYVLNGSSQYQVRPAPPSPPTPCETRAMSPVPDKLLTISPPSDFSSNPSLERRLETAVHVLGTEATALSCLTRLYQTDPVAREGFDRSVGVIRRTMDNRGKLVICGVGKSGHIAKKLVATMNSLRISSTFLHPTEALHGDLGKIGDFDTVIFITFSGRTPELLSLVPHINPQLPLIIVTAHTHPSTCAIIEQRPDAILLPSPIHESETDSFGVSAPTTSTTIALALGDALAVAISNEMYSSVAEVFSRNHPGGAIGQATQAVRTKTTVSDLAVPFSSIPFAGDETGALQAMHVIIAGYQSPSGWVRYSDGSVVPPRRIRRLQPADMHKEASRVRNLVVPKHEWISVPEDMEVADIVAFVNTMRASAPPGVTTHDDDAVLATIGRGEIRGVLEIATLLSAS